MTGAARVAKAAPDGYQFVLGNVGTHAVSQSLSKNPPYNVTADFAPVALFADLSLVLVTRKDLPASNLKEFIAYAKANQAQDAVRLGQRWSATHLGCALLNAAIGVNVTHVPYRGGAPAMKDLVAGRIDYICIDTPAAISLLESGQIKAIAMLTSGPLRKPAECADGAGAGPDQFRSRQLGGVLYAEGDTGPDRCET